MSDRELDEIQGPGLSLFDDEENVVVSSGDSDSIPSPIDDKSVDPNFSFKLKDSLAVPARVTRGEGLRSETTSPVQIQHPIRRASTSVALTQAELEVASTSTGVDIAVAAAAAAAATGAGSQNKGDSKHSKPKIK